MSVESRLSYRVKTKLKILEAVPEAPGDGFALAANAHLEAEAFDLSILGIGLIINHFLPTGMKLKLTIGGVFDKEKEMHVEGEVRYCKQEKKGSYKCGIKFINLSDEHKNKVVNFIASHNRRKHIRLPLN